LFVLVFQLTLQLGQGKACNSTCGCTLSHGPTGFRSSSTLTHTAEWHGAGHLCLHGSINFPHTCWQEGQAPKWQRCGSRLGWWQSGAILCTSEKNKCFSFICLDLC